MRRHVGRGKTDRKLSLTTSVQIARRSRGPGRSGDRGRPRGEFGSPVRLRRASTSSGFGPASRHLHLRRTAGAMQVSTPDWAGALSGLPPGGARRGVETEGVPALGAL